MATTNSIPSVIKWREKVAYGFGDMSSSMFWKIFTMYLLFFYTKVFGISPAAAGTMFLLTRIWDAVNDPMMGLIADRTHSRWGKYRPYLLWGIIPFVLIGVLTFYVPDWGPTGKLAYAYVTYTLMMMAYTLVNVPYASLLGVMSPYPSDRNTLASFRMFFAFAGSFITFMMLQPLVDFFAGLIDPASVQSEQGISTCPMAWTAAVAVVGGVCALLFYLCFKGTRERVQPVDPTKEKTSVKQDLKDLLGNGPWWILLAAGVSVLLFNSIRDGVALFFFSDYARCDFRIPGLGWDMSTIYLLVGQAANMLGVAIAPAIANRVGKKATFMGAMVVGAILSVFFYTIGTNQALILTFQVFISVCAGLIFPLLWSMYADIVDYQELRTGRRATGLIMSSSSMSQKIGWAFGGAVAGWLLSAFGYNADLAVQSEATTMGVRLMVSWLPAAGCVLAVLAVAFYPLGEKKMQEVTRQLNQKRAEAAQ